MNRIPPLFLAGVVALILLGCGNDEKTESQGPIAAIEGKQPLPLPKNFDYEVYMIAKTVNDEKFHGPRASARLCESLLDNGTPEDIANVEQMIPGILSGQNTNPNSPHYGGFRWEIEMEVVEDLNAVQFLLHSLIPIVMDHGDKLQPATVLDIKESIRRGLVNIRKVDVGMRYTNIVLKDIANTCLGGELLGDTAISQRGYDKLKRWREFTDRSGGLYEFNSTPYTAVALEVLYRLQRYVKDPTTKMIAKQMLYRTALGVALHMHEPTRKWAGPHGRAYHGSMVGSTGSYRLDREQMDTFEKWISDGEIPDWLRPLLTPAALDDQVIETVGRDDGLMTSTYKSDTYAFGVASRSMYNQDNRYIAWQTNAFSIHYERPGAEIGGAIYTRYLTNDHWLGYFSAGTGRGTSGLLPDEGHFVGLQDKNRALCLYAPRSMGALHHYSSAKSVVAVARWDASKDRAWVQGAPVQDFPFDVPEGEVIVIETGNIYLAIKPLQLTDLGLGCRVVLDMMDDTTLGLELYNYQGPAKTFWELAWPGEFYQGLPKNGFYAEVVDNTDYESAATFADVVAEGAVTDVADPRSTYTGSEAQKWKVSYERDGKVLGVEVDLFDWLKPFKRWTHEGEVGWPMLESEFAIQGKSGDLSLNGNRLQTATQTSWIYASPDNQIVVASYHGPEPAPLLLETNGGTVAIEELTRGVIVWDHGQVSIEASGLVGSPVVMGGEVKSLEVY